MQDALSAGLSSDETPLAEGGVGALAYGQAVGVYLAFAVDKSANRNNTLCPWMPDVQCPGHLYSRQAIPMLWNYAEANIFGPSGSFESMYKNVIAGLISTYYSKKFYGQSKQFDAQSDCRLRNIVISSDPPYYDNIGYADLSDFFYVWLRRSLRKTYPQLFRTMLVPKAEELVATPYRFDGSKAKARDFFEDGMFKTCCQLYQYARKEVPVTIYYAYKQSESDEGENDSQTASTGWETMLSAIIQAGFAITGTWPMRTERGNRTNAMDTNALASSIVLVCRKRLENAPSITRRNFLAELKRELRDALAKLKSSNIAPVDMAQAAIGPGMGVYSLHAVRLQPYEVRRGRRAGPSQEHFCGKAGVHGPRLCRKRRRSSAGTHRTTGTQSLAPYGGSLSLDGHAVPYSKHGYWRHRSMRPACGRIFRLCRACPRPRLPPLLPCRAQRLERRSLCL